MEREDILNLAMEGMPTTPVELKICKSTKDSSKVYVDFEDYLWAKEFAWCYAKTGKKTYIVKTSGRSNAYRNFEYLHREIMGLTKGDGLSIDHKDGNAFNNCRSNLRIATHAENMRNNRKNNPSGWRGICKSGKKYMANIKVNYQSVYLGTYCTPEVAALARDVGARILHKEFAVLNYSKNMINRYVKRLNEKCLKKYGKTLED